MSERDQRLRERLDDVANASEQWAGYGVKTRTMSHADLAALLREASAALAQREAEIADLMRTLAGLEREASRLEDDREYNAGLCRAREAEIARLEKALLKFRAHGPRRHFLVCNADHSQPIGCDLCICPRLEKEAREAEIAALRQQLGTIHMECLDEGHNDSGDPMAICRHRGMGIRCGICSTLDDVRKILDRAALRAEGPAPPPQE